VTYIMTRNNQRFQQLTRDPNGDKIYPAQVRTRKSLGEMIRKLSVT
jgi:hypothetical protein